MAVTNQDLQAQVELTQKSLRRAIGNLRKAGAEMPASLVDHPIVHLDEEMVREARVYGSRETLLVNAPFTRDGVACEIGTSTGRFAKKIIEVLRPKRMHIVDVDFSRFDRTICGRSGVETYEGDSVAFLKTLPESYLDFAYIDANHSYASVKAEIDAIRGRMKPGSHLMFNDYTRWSINKAEPYGVLSAVNELVNSGCPLVGVALSGTGNYDVAVRVERP